MNKEEIYAKLTIFIGLALIILTLHSLQAYYYYKDKVECQQSNGVWKEYHYGGQGFRWSCNPK